MTTALLAEFVLLFLGPFIAYKCGYKKAAERFFDDGWNCRGIEDARKARAKLDARRGQYGQFAPKKP
jgi:hypothetical protein